MKYVTCKEEAAEKLYSIDPDFKNRRLTGDNSGWCNYVVSVDETWIYRFPRNEKALEAVIREKKVLDALKGKLPEEIEIPEYASLDLSGDYPYVCYKKIQGTHLSKRNFEALAWEEQEKILHLISLFLNVLHSLKPEGLGLDVMTPEREFMPLYDEIRTRAYPYFTEEERKATEKLFESYFIDERMKSYTPSLIHGDFSLDHILLTKDGIGIFDFGDVRIFDPAYDCIFAYSLGEGVSERLLSKVSVDDASCRLEEFYLKRTPYYAVLYSIRMDNDEQFQYAMEDLNRVLEIK